MTFGNGSPHSCVICGNLVYGKSFTVTDYVRVEKRLPFGLKWHTNVRTNLDVCPTCFADYETPQQPLSPIQWIMIILSLAFCIGAIVGAISHSVGYHHP